MIKFKTHEAAYCRQDAAVYRRFAFERDNIGDAALLAGKAAQAALHYTAAMALHERAQRLDARAEKLGSRGGQS